jgi:8-oxo-dGTP diphosphatase
MIGKLFPEPAMSKDTTKEFYCYEYPRPAVTVDVIIATHERKPRVLLIRRRHDPFAGTWAIPGGFVDMDESLEEAATRELREETGVVTKELEQLYTFGEPGRDPRGRTISVVYLARVDPKKVKPRAADDAAEVGWHPLAKLPPLAFDHAQVLALARKRLTSSRKRAGKRPGKAGERLKGGPRPRQ